MLVLMVNERIAAIEAAMPPDLTKIAVDGPTLGLESLVSASMTGDPRRRPSLQPMAVSRIIPRPPARRALKPFASTCNEMIDGQISADVIAINVDKATRTVSLAAVPADLAQIGVGVGAAVTAINGTAPYDFLEGGVAGR